MQTCSFFFFNDTATTEIYTLSLHDALPISPFLTQGLNLDGDRIVMAPGPVLGNFFPNGGYAALQDWVTKNPTLAKNFKAAVDQSLTYAQSHPDEIRALLPAGTQNVRLPTWSRSEERRVGKECRSRWSP